MLVLVSSQYNFEMLREKMSFIRKIAKEREQQSKDKSAENESSGSANIQGIDLKLMFQWCLELLFISNFITIKSSDSVELKIPNFKLISNQFPIFLSYFSATSILKIIRLSTGVGPWNVRLSSFRTSNRRLN